MAVQKPLVIIGGQVQQLPSGDSIPVTYNGGSDPIMSSFAGPVTTSTGTYRYYHPTSTNITGVYISLGTTSSSGSVVIDVKKNGTSIFSGTYPTIAASSHLSSLVSITSALTPSDYLTIDVTSAGVGAADLNVYIVVEATGGGSGGGTTRVSMSAGQTINTTSFMSVTNMPTIALDANSTYLIEGFLTWQDNISGGYQIAVSCTLPSGATYKSEQIVHYNGTGGSTTVFELATETAHFCTAAATYNTDYGIWYRARIITSSTAGDFQLRAKSSTTSGSAVSLRSGSELYCTKVA